MYKSHPSELQIQEQNVKMTICPTVHSLRQDYEE
jgi:hypothetical protein